MMAPPTTTIAAYEPPPAPVARAAFSGTVSVARSPARPPPTILGTALSAGDVPGGIDFTDANLTGAQINITIQTHAAPPAPPAPAYPPRANYPFTPYVLPVDFPWPPYPGPPRFS